MSKKTQRRRRENITEATLNRKAKLKYHLIIEGIGVGLLTGIIVSLFRLTLVKAEEIRGVLIDAAHIKVSIVILCLFLLIFMAVCVAEILKREPLCSGSGIPQVKGELRGQINAKWLQVILAKFIGGVFSIGAGLSLGREGPSIQLGAMVGKGFSRFSNRLRTEEKLLMTCGAGAGLAAAFSAPLAGVVFSLEELHKNFSEEILLSTMASAITADCVASYIFGLRPVFTLTVTNGLPLSHFWMVVVLGIILGAFGVFYNKALDLSQDFFKSIKLSWLRVAIPVIAIVVLAVWYPQALGSGHALVSYVGEGAAGIKLLMVLLVIKFCFSVMSFGTGVPGGIFLPLLVLGAVTGGLFTTAVSPLVGYTNDYTQYFVILGMAGYFAAIVRAPITGIILISEMTGTFSNLLSLSLVSLVAFMTAEILKGVPVYDQLLEKMMDGGASKKPKKSNKVLLESEVYFGSQMEGKPILEMNLPKGCLIVAVQRDNKEIVPNGQMLLKGGDKLTLLCDEYLVSEIEDTLNTICKKIVNL